MTGAAPWSYFYRGLAAYQAGRVDAARVIDRATFASPTELPEGIAWVIVNGRPVLRDGAPTGEYPGALLRQR